MRKQEGGCGRLFRAVKFAVLSLARDTDHDKTDLEQIASSVECTSDRAQLFNR
jgi:hypothetical protein